MASFRYFRLAVTASNGSSLVVGEFALYVGAMKYPASTMTADNAPSPLVASGSNTEEGGSEYFKAFDNLATTGWGITSFTAKYLQIDLGAGNAIAADSYKLTASTTLYGQMASAWTVQGSSDGTNFIVLDTQTSQTGWLTTEVRTYSISALAVSLTAAVAAFILTGKTVIRALGFPVALASAFVLTGKTTIQAIARAAAVGAFTLTGRTAGQLIKHLSSKAAYVFTGIAATLGTALLAAVATFTFTAKASILVWVLGPVDRIRQMVASLYKTRQTPPGLDE